MSECAEANDWVAGRYRVVRELGRGGMAVVSEVVDSVTGDHVALKQLLPTEPIEERELLFQQEYHGLSNLSHPRIVRVFDYGRDHGGSVYYTMELLLGGDLRARAPLHYERVCALLSDVCSALSLLHSRRLLHRDLTPRNVRCTDDGTAKLIDFGAIVPFGRSFRAVGTPPYCAPEMLDGDELDARTDLFALGATAYFALSGHHAYPARDFLGLRECLRTLPIPLSERVPMVPPALSELVSDLLQPDRAKRPATAAEVMERLSAIGGVDITEQVVVPQSYLVTPALVGRREPLDRVIDHLMQGVGGQGSALMVTAPAGFGRTRFLSACVLEAKLLGAVVLRAQGDGQGTPFAAARALIEGLLEQMPGLLSQLSVDERFWVESILSTGRRVRKDLSPKGAQEDHPRFQRAIRALFLQAARARCVVLAVDDCHLLDQPSLALCALLAHQVEGYKLVLIGSRDPQRNDERPALAALLNRSQVLRLGPLSLEDTQSLLASMFGQAPNLSWLALHLFRVSSGAPRPLLQLAQHLLDQGTMVYRAGAWTFPGEFDGRSLPRSLADAIFKTVGRLSPSALFLARAVALVRPLSLGLDELFLVSDCGDQVSRDGVLSALDELVRLKVLRVNQQRYTLHHEGLLAPLLSELHGSPRRELHRRLAAVFRRRGLGLRVVENLYFAGDPDGAIDSLTALFSELGIDVGYTLQEVQTLPCGWFECLQRLLRHCEDQGRPAMDAYVVRAMMLEAQPLLRAPLPTDHIEALFAQLEHDCGLDLYRRVDPLAEPAARMRRAMELAQARYDASPPDKRVAPPAVAVPWLVRTVLQVVGYKAHAFDHGFLAKIPSLAALSCLSPAFTVVQLNVDATREAAAGRVLQAMQLYQQGLARLSADDGAELDGSFLKFAQLSVRYALEQVRVSRGIPPSEATLGELAADPLFEINAQRLQFLYALRCGQFGDAERYGEQLHLLELQQPAPQMFEGLHLLTECEVRFFSGDLAGLKQVLVKLERMVHWHPTWLPVLLLGRGNYECLRGDYGEALRYLEQGVEKAPIGGHTAAGMVAAARILCLLQLGRVEDALAASKAALAAADRAQLKGAGYRLHLAHALVLAEVGAFGRAAQVAEEALALLRAQGAGGTVLAYAHEVRARVAVCAGAERAFENHAGSCAALYLVGRNGMLTVRYGRLLRYATTRGLRVSAALRRAADPDGQLDLTPARPLVSYPCPDPVQRAQSALLDMVKSCEAAGGFLYRMQAQGAELAAQVGGYPPPEDLDQRAQAFLDAALLALAEEITCTTCTVRDKAPAWVASDGGRFFPVLVAHQGRNGLECTAVVALRSANGHRIHPPSSVTKAVSRALANAEDITVVRGDRS